MTAVDWKFSEKAFASESVIELHFCDIFIVKKDNCMACIQSLQQKKNMVVHSIG